MKKLKIWQFILLIIFYPIGIIYFFVWLLRKSKLKKESAVNKPIQCEIVTKVPAENINCTDSKSQEVSINLEDLLSNVEKAHNQTDKHFAYMSLQNYYYKKRKESPENMKACIEWCLRDISELDKLDLDFHRQLQEEKKKHIAILGEKGFKKWHNNGYYNQSKFDAHIIAFEKLAIIYEQAKDYDNAISIVEQAIFYYTTHNQKWLPDAQKRLERLKNKAKKE